MGRRNPEPPKAKRHSSLSDSDDDLSNKMSKMKVDGKSKNSDFEMQEGEKGKGKQGQMPLLQKDTYASVQIPELEKWNPDDIKLDGTVIAIGKRRTGKSWAFRNLMYLMKDQLPGGIVFSQTDELNKFWCQYIPKQFIFKEYDPAVLDMVFARQKKILNDKNLTKEEREKKAKFFILLDDVISDTSIKYDRNMMELFVAGRHYKLFVLITTQYAKAVTPCLRGNTDYVLIFKCMQGRQREALLEDFGDFMTKDGFYTILDAYTEDQEMLVIDTSENTNDPMTMLKWWRAEDPGEFKLGTKEYWKAADDEEATPPANLGSEPMSARDLIDTVSLFHPKWQRMFKENCD